MSKRIICAVTLIFLMLSLVIMALSIVGLIAFPIIADSAEEGMKKLFDGITE